MTEPAKTPEVVELFIGRFEIVDSHTGVATGEAGYVGILLNEQRVALMRTTYYQALQPLIDDVKQSGHALSADRHKVTFEPAQPYEHAARDQAVVTTALTLDEIDRVQVALGRY